MTVCKQDGKSVMVEVATGGNSGESLPLLIKFPRSVGPGPCSAQQSYSLLGFGDIIVPGFLVCFGHSFDIIRGDKFRPYFIVTMIGTDSVERIINWIIKKWDINPQ